mgnify:CR=1 FL=1
MFNFIVYVFTFRRTPDKILFAQWIFKKFFTLGYLVLALGVAVFVIAFAVGFSGPLATTVIVCLVVSSVLLAPSIVLGYAVRAAERDDVEQGR